MPERSSPLRGVAAAALVAALVLAVAALLVRAFADAWRAPALVPQEWGTRGVDVAFAGPVLEAIVTSLIVGVAVTALALALAWPAARALGERRLARPGPVLVLLALPLLVPSYAIGDGLTEWLLRLGLADTLPGIVLGHLVLVLPYVLVVLASGFGPQLRELEEMARAQGLAPHQRLRWVTLPSVRPTLAVAAVLGFLVSWSEYGISLAVGGGRPLLPVVLLPFVGADPQVAATLALLLLAPAAAALVLAARATRAPL